MCGLTPDRTLRHLVVDELTYDAFLTTREPYIITYLVGGWGRGITDLGQLLREHRSAGLIAGCHRLPPALQARARRNGAYCCLPAFE